MCFSVLGTSYLTCTIHEYTIIGGIRVFLNAFLFCFGVRSRHVERRARISSVSGKGMVDPRPPLRYRDESRDEEIDRRFFVLEGRFAEVSESLGGLWGILMQQHVEVQAMRKQLGLYKTVYESMDGTETGGTTVTKKKRDRFKSIQIDPSNPRIPA